MLTFLDLQNEIKRRAVRDQSGSEFETGIKNLINTSLFRISREALWRSLRRKSTITTVPAYATGSGSGSYTNGSMVIAVTSAAFVTDSIRIGRRIKLSGDGTYHIIKSISSDTLLTIEKDYAGSSATNGTYSILGQEEYVLPVQCGFRMFLWHEEYGYPFILTYQTDQEFYSTSSDNTAEAVPERYRMWGEDMVSDIVRTASNIGFVSSSSSDTSQSMTVFGTVAEYPHYENIALNGTTTVSTTNLFTAVERVVKDGSTLGRITVSSIVDSKTLAVIPMGDTTAGVLYKKIQIYPLPDTEFPINIQYYKDPYRLVNDYDVHELGQDFDEAIIMLCVAKLKYENSQTEGDRWYELHQDEIRNLRKTNVDKIDWFPGLKKAYSLVGARVAPNLLYSQIGAYYGPSSRF